MKQTSISSAQTPKAVGSYSQAVLVENSNIILYISGQIPESAEGNAPSDFDSQCRLVWANILSLLESAEMSRSNLGKVTTFLSSRDYAQTNSKIRTEILGDLKPALTVIITEIYNKDWLLEIEAIATA